MKGGSRLCSVFFFFYWRNFAKKEKKIQKSKNPILKFLKRDILDWFSVSRREGEKRNKNKFKKEIKIARYIYKVFFILCSQKYTRVTKDLY